MASVRQTVTTVQTSQSPGQLDNSLDALLEDLQISVARNPTVNAVNGIGGNSNRTYREVTRTVQQEGPPRDYQVQYLSAANPTTVLSERSSSPMNPTGEQRSVTAYKTVSYQYKTSEKQTGSAPVLDNTTASATSDARLQQNLTELDSLLVDLHQAQKAGFGSPQGSSVTTRTDVVTSDIDPALLEPLEHSTPAPPARQPQPHISRSVYKYSTQQYSSDNVSPIRYQVENTPSPCLQPKRSSSANRELTYGHDGSHSLTTRSPSPLRQRDVAPLEPPPNPYSPQHPAVQREVYYETKSGTATPTTSHSSTMPPERYRDKSPSNQRLHREMYYETKTMGSVPPSPHYRETSPPSQRRGISPVPPTQPISGSPDLYAPQPGGTSRITTVRTYNYSTNTGTPPPPVSRSPYPSVSPSPIPVSRSPYPDSVTVTELPHTPHRSPSPPPSSVVTYSHQTLPPTSVPYPPPQQIPGQPPTKVITTVHTYTYELPGQPGVQHPYPPPGPTYVNSVPPDTTDYGPGDHTLMYHVSPQIPREKEPLLPAQPQPIVQPAEPQQPPTVITYKYSTHSHTTNKYPGPPPQPEEQQPLLPRPFPTSSPTPGQSDQPPKRLDDLMASFSDQKLEPIPVPTYYKTEKQATSTTTTSPHSPPKEGNGVAVVTPATTNSTKVESQTKVKERVKTTNVAGPPVYYPPGVELFARKEESMVKGSKKGSASAKYKYESESKSKSSSGGGAAVVPVCLPLCCAMPCVIL